MEILLKRSFVEKTKYDILEVLITDTNMKYLSIHRILALSNLFLLSLLVTDDFLITPKHSLQVFSYVSSAETRSANPALSHFSYFIVSKSGKRFQIPANEEGMDHVFNNGDTFFVDISRIFNRPVKMDFPLQKGFLSIKTGILNNGFYGKIMMIYILLVSLIHVLPVQIIKRDNLNERLIFSGTAILMVLLFFYFYQ